MLLSMKNLRAVLVAAAPGVGKKSETFHVLVTHVLKGHCSYLNRHHLLTSYNRFQENVHNDHISSILYDMCKGQASEAEMTLNAMPQMMSLLQERRHDKNTFFIYLGLLQICWHLEHSLAPNVLLAWQVRLARSYLLSSSTSTDESTELMLAVTAQLGKVFDNFVSENKQLVEAVTSNRRMEASRILTRSHSFHDTEQYLVDSSGLPKLKQLASYLVYNSIQLRLSSNLPTSPTKRRSRHKNDDNSLTSALLRLKQLKDLDLPTVTCLKVL